MNIILQQIASSGNQPEVQGITILMILTVSLVFIMSWAVNRISILRIRKNTEKIQELHTVLQHTLNISHNYALKFSTHDRMGYNLHGDFLPEGGLDFESSLQFIHSEDRPLYVEFFEKFMNGAKTAECAFRWDHSKENHRGHWRHIHAKGIAEFVNKNQKIPMNIYCTLTDKTEQIEQEQAEDLLTRKYRIIFEQGIAGLAFYDKDGRLITANKKMRKILKFQSERDPFYYDNTIYDMPTFREILNNHHIEELFFCTKSIVIERGVNCYTELRVHPLHNEEGELLYITLSIRDITQERELYLKNKENDENIHRINEAVLQYETRLQYLMDMCDMRFFRASCIDKTITIYRNMSAPERKMDFDELTAFFQDCPFRAGLMDFENYFNVPRTDLTHMQPLFHEGNALQWNFIDSVPFFDKSGKLTGSYGIIRNITPLIEKQEQLKLETERANDSGQRKSVFMANMTHEIRTPLNAIVGFSDVLPMLQTEEEKKEIIHVIMTNCDMLMRLTNNILAASHLETEDVEIMPEETDFPAYFGNICQSLAKRVEMPGVEFIAENPCTSLRVFIDKERIMQMLTNFVTNAVKYTQQGHIKVGYEYREAEGGGLYLYCEDTGSGIPKENQARIFERFVKLNDYVQGTGLGLSIAKAIAEQCGGKIGVISEGTGKGSTFWVWIPCKRLEMTPEQTSTD